MMKTVDPMKKYDSIEYGILLPDSAVVPERRKTKKRMSWPKCLCLTLLVIVALFVLTSAVGALWGYFWMKHQVKRFTTDKGTTLPIHELPDAELEILKDRAKLFYDTVRAGKTPVDDFVLTQDEINALVAHSDYLRGHAFVHLTENNFSADMSLPAKGLPGGKGRFFVASGSLTMSTTEEEQTKITTALEPHYKIEGLEYPQLLLGEFLVYIATDGTKTVNLLSGQFYNWVAPPDYIAKKENLLNEVCDEDDDEDDQDCRDFMMFLDGLEDISIHDQKITFHPRSTLNGETRRRRLSSAKTPKSVSKKTPTSYGGYARRSLMRMML